ncbi:protein SENESCENCE-ASSOCIATED GENE 21, mitochondrial-like [Rhodamnia argentea]|uniref:Protein SENESCENCE-ASSOCIATED GENE 21, mitochondrial-like n=1 Tax=Rhodamnia argentea TaxID=178133 RepID=A0A8B8PDG0_9MYRT|nr:protein SENESCENCE-ASSOCIATED GENE 21, mitochondrial-like [Rhodamnia argentea]
MARSLLSAKLIFALAADAMSNTVARRGYSTAARGATPQVAKARGATRSRAAAAVKKTGEEEKMARSDGQVSRAPDPRTGYYRPEDCIAEMDVAELLAELLREKE